MLSLFALWSGPIQTWGVADFAVAVVIIAALIALVWIALAEFNVGVPPWVIKVFWVVVVAAVVIFAIRLVASM